MADRQSPRRSPRLAAAASAAETPSRSPVDEYDILSTLGKGAFSVVKKAKDKRTGELVAIKFINKSKQPKNLPILNEINILTKLSREGCSKHILCFIEAFEDGDTYYLVTEYVDGVSLLKYVRDTSLLDKDEINLMLQIGEVVMSLHNAGIAHRDLKPENILVYQEVERKGSKVTKTAKVKLLDFGLSCDVYRRIDAPCTSVLLGTPRYIAPELWQRKVRDARTPDIFALACIFYFIATQSYLFNGDSTKEIADTILAGKHNKLDSINENLAELITRMISDVEERPKIRKIIEKLWELE